MKFDRHLAARLEDWAERSGDDLALAWLGGGWTYRELAAAARRRAAAMQVVGVRRGTHVGLLLANRAEWLACAFGAWRLGAVLVPINTLYQTAELRHALDHADVEVLISEDTFLRHDYRAHLRQLCPRLFDDAPDGAAVAAGGVGRAVSDGTLPRLRSALFCGTDVPATWSWDAAVGAVTAAENGAPPADGDAAIFFTSGSTADAKGVVHTHASMITAAVNVGDRLGLGREDRTYGYLPLFFNGGLVGVALATLERGGAVLLQDVFDAGAAIRLMEAHRCSVFFGWPHQAEAIARHPSFDRARLSLRKGPGANASWAAALLRDDHQCVGTWGMTETGPMAACSHHAEPLEIRRASHGRAMPGLEIRIVDESGQTLPSGASGEIAVRGSSLMRTYYRSTPAESFDAEGFFHTGDQGLLDGAGRLTFLGRLRDVIKTAGVNVAAAEVERALLEHPAVESAFVVPVPHPTRGENVAAFVVADVDVGDLERHCRERLASYKVPRHFFPLDAADIPSLGSGKVDRKRLRERAAALVVTRAAPGSKPTGRR